MFWFPNFAQTIPHKVLLISWQQWRRKNIKRDFLASGYSKKYNDKKNS